MRNRLALIVALAAFGLVVGAAMAGAQGGLLDSKDPSVNLPGGDEGGAAGALPQCSNGVDDDGDGDTDLKDGGCANNPLGNNEGAEGSPPPPPEPEPSPPIDDGGDGDGGKGGKDPLDDAPKVPSGDKKPGGGKGKGPGKGSGGTSGSGEREKLEKPDIRRPDGSPTRSNPTLSVTDFRPAPIGISNDVIDSFEIPPFLLPIYQACGTQYGIPWPVLASINQIETNFGQLAGVTSSAGAIGWMQFLPSSWKAYGVDANGDGRKDPYNPVDAICAAGRYLRAAGGQDDLRKAIFAYNHADWYVDQVLAGARRYGRLPDDLVGSLTGLTENAHFPVAARSRYADDLAEREAMKRAKKGKDVDLYESSPTRRGINIFAKEGAPVVAVNDGVIKKIGTDPELGKYIVLQDAYGNRFTYAELGKLSKAHPVPKERDLDAKDFQLITPKRDPKPNEPASDGEVRKRPMSDVVRKGKTNDKKRKGGPANTENSRDRLFALPERPRNVDRASLSGQLDALLGEKLVGYESFKSYFSGVLKFDRRSMDLRPLRKGSKVVAGTVLGRVGKTDELGSHLNFEIRPTGRGAPNIDPKPILDGWKLLEATAIYNAAGKDPFKTSTANVGRILLLSKAQLQRRVLANPRLEIYACGREDIRTGQIDRRVLAMMEYLAASGFRLTATSLKCGRTSIYTSSGGVSHHASGNAVDIAQVNGLPILGNQGRGSITEAVVQQLLKLQGTMEPAQVISLMEMGGPTFAMGDHADHIHVGYQPMYSPRKQGKQFVQVMKPRHWERLIGRIAEIENPKVRKGPADQVLPARKRASSAHFGE